MRVRINFWKHGTETEPIRDDIETWVRGPEIMRTSLDLQVRVYGIRILTRTPEYDFDQKVLDFRPKIWQ